MSITNANQQFSETIRGRWRLDPQRSSVGFRTGHFWGLLTVKGQFEDYRGRLDLSADPAMELTIDASSVQTGHAKRDRHLRSADFFDAPNHPAVQFVSDSVELHGDTPKVHGRLSARGQSIPLELEPQVRQTEGGLEIEAVITVPHRELGMTWSPLGMIPPRSELSVKAYLVPDDPTPDTKRAA